MPRKKRSHEPKDIEDLESIFYDQNRVEDRRKYETGFGQEIVSDAFERSLSTKIGRPLEKVKEKKGVKTPDYISTDRCVVIEATTINPSFQPDNTYDSEDFRIVDKINNAIEHAEAKNLRYIEHAYKLKPGSYDHILAAQVDFRAEIFFSFSERLATAIRQSRFSESNLDAVLFFPEPVASNRALPKPFGFRKKPSIELGVDSSIQWTDE
jgi:hypothetical protein